MTPADNPINKIHLKMSVSSPVFVLDLRVLSVGGNFSGFSDTGGVLVTIGGMDSFLNFGSMITSHTT